MASTPRRTRSAAGADHRSNTRADFLSFHTGPIGLVGGAEIRADSSLSYGGDGHQPTPLPATRTGKALVYGGIAVPSRSGRRRPSGAHRRRPPGSCVGSAAGVSTRAYRGELPPEISEPYLKTGRTAPTQGSPVFANDLPPARPPSWRQPKPDSVQRVGSRSLPEFPPWQTISSWADRTSRRGAGFHAAPVVRIKPPHARLGVPPPPPPPPNPGPPPPPRGSALRTDQADSMASRFCRGSTLDGFTAGHGAHMDQACERASAAGPLVCS